MLNMQFSAIFPVPSIYSSLSYSESSLQWETKSVLRSSDRTMTIRAVLEDASRYNGPSAWPK